MGIMRDSGEKPILVDGYENPSVGEVKAQVRKEFKLVPNSKITFLVGGKRYGEEDDHLPFKKLPLDPRSDKVMVIVSNPHQ